MVDAKVGSKQMQEIRIKLRGKATILMGKNTMIRTCLRNHMTVNPAPQPIRSGHV